MINYQQKQLERDLRLADWTWSEESGLGDTKYFIFSHPKLPETVDGKTDCREPITSFLEAYNHKITKATSADACKLKIMYGVGQLSHLLALKLGLSEWKDEDLDELGCWKVKTHLFDGISFKLLEKPIYSNLELRIQAQSEEEAINHEITQNALKREIGVLLAKMMFWACRYMSRLNGDNYPSLDCYSCSDAYLEKTIIDILSEISFVTYGDARDIPIQIGALARKLEIDPDKHFEEICG